MVQLLCGLQLDQFVAPSDVTAEQPSVRDMLVPFSALCSLTMSLCLRSSVKESWDVDRGEYYLE